jgi:broad specificity phosphatase PhoE
VKNPSADRILRLFLVRHGQTDWNKIRRFQGQPGIGLNETGKAQAEALASALRKEPIQVIYSSPLARGIETANAINRYHQVPIEQREGLMEMDLGDFEGLRSAVVMEEHPDFFKAWSEDPASVRMPNGESLGEVQERAWAVVEEIAGAHPEGSVVLCGHHFVNLTILCKIVGLELTHFRRLRQAPGALNIIERGDGRYSLVCINDTCHLKAIDGSGRDG